MLICARLLGPGELPGEVVPPHQALVLSRWRSLTWCHNFSFLLPSLPCHLQKAGCLCPTEDAGYKTPVGFLSRVKASLDLPGTELP